MMEKIKSNLTYVVCAGIGLINFILLAIPYVASFYSYDFGEWGGKQSNTAGVSGYNVMDMWELGFSGVMSSIIQIFVLILGIALLAFGVMGLLKAFGIFNKLPDKIGNFESKQLGFFGLVGLAGLNFLLLIFLIILTASNTEKSEFASAGIKLSAGIFISIIFTAGAVVGLKVLEKKLPANGSSETVTYACKKCGKKAKATDKFCNACGGEIETKVIKNKEYTCEKCGKKAKATDKFCNVCGGEIKLKEEPAVMQETAVTTDEVVTQD